MRTKIFTLCFALVASVGTIFAESGTCGENLTWDLTDSVLTISGTGEMDPDAFSIAFAYGWGCVETPWHNFCTGEETERSGSRIKTVILADGITSIGSGAFCGFSSLISIEIPNSVTSIGSMAFSYCPALTSIIVGDGNTIYDSRNNCNALIETSSNKLIAGCQNTIIPNTVTSIGYNAFAGCKNLTSVTIPNSVKSIGSYAFLRCSGLKSVQINDLVAWCSIVFGDADSNPLSYAKHLCLNGVEIKDLFIPNSVKSIGNYAFYECGDLTSVTIPNSVKSIGDYAFRECRGLKAITCLTTNPPSLGNNYSAFADVDKSIPLYVPEGSVSSYRSADGWKDFTNIVSNSAQETETNTLKAEPTTNSVEVIWPVVAGAYTYELVIKDKSGNVVCTLVFNAQGQLQSIVFAAPSRDGSPQKKQEAGFAFTITGLAEATSYDVIITAKDNGGNTLDTKITSFTTEGDAPTGIDDINAATKSQKIVRDNQVLILRDGKTFNAQGIEVK